MAEKFSPVHKFVENLSFFAIFSQLQCENCFASMCYFTQRACVHKLCSFHINLSIQSNLSLRKCEFEVKTIVDYE